MYPHILSFNSREMKIDIRDSDTVSNLDTKGEMRLLFSKYRQCIGYRSDSSPNPWNRCPAITRNIRQCPLCSYRDISRIYTIGDFSLYPHLEKELENESYYIYLAAFGEDKIKCGITKNERLNERFIEQGADFGCALFEVNGLSLAFRIEKELQETFGFSNAVFIKEKIARINFDSKKAKENLKRAIERVLESDVFCEFSLTPRILDLGTHYPYVTNALESKKIDGKILGAKGLLLFWSDAEDNKYLINMKSQEGRFLVSFANL
ncbi:MAG: DUF2797 domain-containing protein [Candidatus Anstonellales archaeon]